MTTEALGQKIKSVEKGWGENSIFFSVNVNVHKLHKVDEIREESKQVSPDHMFNVYRGYIDGKLVFEMGASVDVTVCYENK